VMDSNQRRQCRRFYRPDLDPRLNCGVTPDERSRRPNADTQAPTIASKDRRQTAL
jgi:hypothetical protein